MTGRIDYELRINFPFSFYILTLCFFKQMMLLHMQSEAMKSRGMGLSPGFSLPQIPGFPPMSSYEPFQTKSVLQNDFLTAKQMADSGGYAASLAAQQLEKEKATQALLAAGGGKVSPAPHPTASMLD